MTCSGKLSAKSQRTKLWIISELFPPEETSTAYIMGEIARAFSSKYNVGVICGPEVYDRSRKQSDRSLIYEDIELHRADVQTFDKNKLAGKTRSFISTTLSLYKLAKKLIKPADKVLMVTNPAPLIILMIRLKKSHGFELNILVHDVFPENTKAAGLKLPMYGLVKNLFDKAYSNADRLIVLGRDMADLMTLKTKGCVPVSIIENWGDFTNIKPVDMPVTERIILEYAGNIGRVQGLEKIIDELPDNIDLHIYGAGALEEKLRSMGKPNVYFHGPYSRGEQTDILGACHISLVTLNDRMYGLGTPSKTYNILASGRPILYFGPKDSEIELLVMDYNIGYCGWPEKWDIGELKIMGANARILGEKHYSETAILNKFLNII